jgi:hypothetical protein
MANKHYTWAPIKTDSGEIEAGTVVTAKTVGDDFDALVKCGAIRTRVYPKMPATWKGSVRSFRQEQIRALRAGLDARDLLDIAESEEDENEYLELLASVEDGASE